MKNYLFFDSASTTKCCEIAIECLHRYSAVDYGNPASMHAYGKTAARAMKEARAFFADHFRVEPEQVIFTGSGTEANNLALYGISLAAKSETPSTLLASATEHASVRNTLHSLKSLGFKTQLIPVDPEGQIQPTAFFELLDPSVKLVSIQSVNNITGAILPIAELAQEMKKRAPHSIFHTDAIQAFGKIPIGKLTGVDLLSISGHKINGPKGVGALIVFNRSLLKSGLRPLIWGGEQENGFRSGTQNVGLIAGFHKAAVQTLARQKESFEKVSHLRSVFQNALRAQGLLSAETKTKTETETVRWLSPQNSVPHIISLSIPGFPAAAFAGLLEEKGCLISVGSACHSRKPQPDPVLDALGLPTEIQSSAFRVSLSADLEEADIHTLAQAMKDSIAQMSQLLGKTKRKPVHV